MDFNLENIAKFVYLFFIWLFIFGSIFCIAINQKLLFILKELDRAIISSKKNYVLAVSPVINDLYDQNQRFKILMSLKLNNSKEFFSTSKQALKDLFNSYSDLNKLFIITYVVKKLFKSK